MWMVANFNTNSKLTAADGSLILEFKDIRFVAYEAAVPPNMTVEVHGEPYAGVSWKPDISTLSPAQAIQLYLEIQSAADAVSKIVEFINHEQPLTSILFVGTPSLGTLDTILKAVSATTTVAIADSSEGFEEVKARFGDHIATLPISNRDSLDLTELHTTPQDLVIVAMEFGHKLSVVKSVLTKKGKLLFSVVVINGESAHRNLITIGLATAELRFDLPDVTVVMSSTSSIEPYTNEVEPEDITLMATDT